MTEDHPYGYVVLDPGGPKEATYALTDRIFVGRECAGVDDSRRILLGDDLAISRNHLEFRFDPELSRVVVVDTSSNGTRVNGLRIERSVGVALSAGDRIQVGEHLLEFRGENVVTRPVERQGSGSTIATETPTKLAMVVGDIINFSTVSEQVDQQLLARDTDRLYKEVRDVLSRHTLVDYVGDAFFACWEVDADSEGVNNALDFAIKASERVATCTDDFEVRYADGRPLTMGWACTIGQAVMRLMPGSVVTVLGDAVNVGFRLSGIAGREGRPTVLATEGVRNASTGSFSFGEPETVSVKGRVGTVTIYGVHRS